MPTRYEYKYVLLGLGQETWWGGGNLVEKVYTKVFNQLTKVHLSVIVLDARM